MLLVSPLSHKGEPLSKALNAPSSAQKPMTRCPGLSCSWSASLMIFLTHGYAYKRFSVFPHPTLRRRRLFLYLSNKEQRLPRCAWGLIVLPSRAPAAALRWTWRSIHQVRFWAPALLFAAARPAWREEQTLRNVSGNCSPK